MKIVELIELKDKNYATKGKKKYFHDLMQAVFYLESSKSSKKHSHHATFESCFALEHDGTYHRVSESEISYSCYRGKETDRLYSVYNYDNRKKERPSLPELAYSTDEFNDDAMYLSPDHKGYWIDEKIFIEKPQEKYLEIKPVIDKALEEAKPTRKDERKSRQAFFKANEEKLARKKEKLAALEEAQKETKIAFWDDLEAKNSNSRDSSDSESSENEASPSLSS